MSPPPDGMEVRRGVRGRGRGAPHRERLKRPGGRPPIAPF
jgi:hypothetical protein